MRIAWINSKDRSRNTALTLTCQVRIHEALFNHRSYKILESSVLKDKWHEKIMGKCKRSLLVFSLQQKLSIDSCFLSYFNHLSTTSLSSQEEGKRREDYQKLSFPNPHHLSCKIHNINSTPFNLNHLRRETLLCPWKKGIWYCLVFGIKISYLLF
jgi:hypothetical protein